MIDFWKPLCSDVIKRRWADDREADEEDVGLGVGEWSQSVVIFLSCCIPQSQADGLSINHHTGGVVVENCRYVFARERVRSV